MQHVSWPETYQGRVLRARNIIGTLLEETASRTIDAHLESGTTAASIDIKGMLQCIRADVCNVMQALSDTFPTIDDSELSDLVHSRRVDSAHVNALQLRLYETQDKFVGLESQVIALKAFCRRKDSVIDYIRKTLFAEVVALREQLFRATNNPNYESAYVSIFDYLKLMEGDVPADPSGETAMALLKKEYTNEAARTAATHALAMKRKDEELANLSQTLSAVQLELQSVRTSSEVKCKKRRGSASMEEDEVLTRHLKAELEEATTELTSVREQLESKERQCSQIEDSLVGFRSQMERAQSEAESIIEAKEKELIQKAQVLADLEMKNRQLEQFKVQNLASSKKSGEVSKRLDEMEMKTESALAEASALKAERNLLRDKLDIATKELDGLKMSSVNESLAREKAIQKEQKRLTEELEEMKAALEEERGRAGELSNDTERLLTQNGDLQTALDQARLDLGQSRELYGKRAEELTNTTTALAAANDEICVVKEELHTAKEMIQKLQKELLDNENQHREKLAALQATSPDAAKVVQERDRLKAENVDLEKNMAQLNFRAGDFKVKLDEASSELLIANEKVSDLREKLSTAQMQMSEYKSRLTKANVKLEYAEMELSSPRRMSPIQTEASPPPPPSPPQDLPPQEPILTEPTPTPQEEPAPAEPEPPSPAKFKWTKKPATATAASLPAPSAKGGKRESLTNDKQIAQLSYEHTAERQKLQDKIAELEKQLTSIRADREALLRRAATEESHSASMSVALQSDLDETRARLSMLETASAQKTTQIAMLRNSLDAANNDIRGLQEQLATANQDLDQANELLSDKELELHTERTREGRAELTDRCVVTCAFSGPSEDELIELQQVAAENAVLSDAVLSTTEHGGKHFLSAAFASVDTGLEWALRVVQDAHDTAPGVAVSCGSHSGPCVIEDGQVFGPTLARSVALAAAAAPGATALTDEVFELSKPLTDRLSSDGQTMVFADSEALLNSGQERIHVHEMLPPGRQHDASPRIRDVLWEPVPTMSRTAQLQHDCLMQARRAKQSSLTPTQLPLADETNAIETLVISGAPTAEGPAPSHVAEKAVAGKSVNNSSQETPSLRVPRVLASSPVPSSPASPRSPRSRLSTPAIMKKAFSPRKQTRHMFTQTSVDTIDVGISVAPEVRKISTQTDSFALQRMNSAQGSNFGTSPPPSQPNVSKTEIKMPSVLHEQSASLELYDGPQLRRGLPSTLRRVHGPNPTHKAELSGSETMLFVGQPIEEEQVDVVSAKEGPRPRSALPGTNSSIIMAKKSQARSGSKTKQAAEKLTIPHVPPPQLPHGLADRSKFEQVPQHVLDWAGGKGLQVGPQRYGHTQQRNDESGFQHHCRSSTPQPAQSSAPDVNMSHQAPGGRNDAPKRPATSMGLRAPTPTLTVDRRKEMAEVFVGTGSGAAVRGVKGRLKRSVDVDQFLTTFGPELFKTDGAQWASSPNSVPFR